MEAGLEGPKNTRVSLLYRTGKKLCELVSSPDAPPTRGKELLVAIDAKLGPMTSLSSG